VPVLRGRSSNSGSSFGGAKWQEQDLPLASARQITKGLLFDVA